MSRIPSIKRNMGFLFYWRSARAASIVFFVIVALLPLCGCRKSGVGGNAIRGSVQLDGNPLQEGSIRFMPIEGTKARFTGGEIKDGRYELSDDAGPLAGTYQVQIHAMRKTGRKVPLPTGFGKVEMTDEWVEAIAPEFNVASTLRVEVKATNDNVADFQVSSK